MATAVQGTMDPNQDTMLGHLTHHFCSDLEGQVEIRIIKPKGAVYSKLFSLDELEEAAAHACEMNQRGFNIYFGAVLRRESLESGEHGMDDDCLGARMLWLDIDDDGVAETAAQELKGKGITPTYTVVTGRTPHTRVQMFFEVDEPITDSQQIAEMNQALAERFGGDPVVFNVGRIMRLGGAIAWPGKEGRVKELTEFHPQQVEPLPLGTLVSKLSLQEALERAVERRNTYEGGQGITKEPAGLLGGSETVVDGREEYMRNCVMAAFIEAFGTAEAGQAVTEQTIFDLAWPVFEQTADMSRPGHNTQREMHAKCSKILRRFQEGKLKDFKTQDDIVKTWEAKQELAHIPPKVVVENIPARVEEVLTTARRFPLAYSGDVRDVVRVDQLVHGLLVQGTTSVVYGDSNVGKSFWAIDLAYCVATGRPWNGSKVKQKGVVYVSMEGGQTTKNRMLAYKKAHPFQGEAHFALIPAAVNLFDSEDDIATLVATIQDAASHMGVEVGLIVVDTLARAMAGGNENTSEDMGLLIRNIDALAALTEAHVMLVHHTGKDKTRGARGSSALRAATDTEIQLEKIEGTNITTVTVTKQRDLEGGQSYNFKLMVTEVGNDTDGDPITSCYVELDDTDYSPAKQRLTTLEGMAWNKVKECFQNNAEMRTVMADMAPQNACSIDLVRKTLRGRGVTEKDNDNTERSQWKRIREGLVNKGYIEINGDYMWLVDE